MDILSVLALRFRVVVPDDPARELLQKSYSRRTRLSERTAKTVAFAWNAEPAEIMKEFLADLKPVLPLRRPAS